MTGTVTGLHSTFGFIRAQDGREFFFHREDVVGAMDFDQLVEGDGVSFEAAEPQPARGPRAQRVAWHRAQRAKEI